MRSKRIYIIIILALVTVSLITAIAIRHSFRRFMVTDDAISDFWMSVDSRYDPEILDLSGGDLLAAADLVVLVEPTEERAIRNGYILTKVIIAEVLVSNGSVSAGDVIYIYEPTVANLYEGNEFILTYGTLNLMQQGTEYLALLKLFDQGEYLEYDEIDAATYVLVNELFGMYPFPFDPDDSMLNSEILGCVELVPYKNVRGVPCLFGDEALKGAYCEKYEAILKDLDLNASP